jgi:hypothetical protein
VDDEYDMVHRKRALLLQLLLLVLAGVGAEVLQCNVSSGDQDALDRWTAAAGLTFSRDCT